MTAFLILKLLHILALVYWLGGDLGTFFSSRFVVDPSLTPAQRQTALRIMLGCDQGPKLCMPLIFAIGYSMSTTAQIIIAPTWLTAAVWIVAAAWFANVNYLYFAKNLAVKARLTRIDLWFRIVLVAVLIAVAMDSLMFGRPFHADWLAVKLIAFAMLVTCGIYIRIQLKPFISAFVQLQSSGSTAAIERTLTHSLARCRPAVFLIWLGLIVNSAIGLHLINI